MGRYLLYRQKFERRALGSHQFHVYWYKNSLVCYAYLSDESLKANNETFDNTFAQRRWYRQGWTLRELVAPGKVRFLDRRGMTFGSKKELFQKIAQITGIDEDILINSKSLSRCSIAYRMSWASIRETTREEDVAYSLLGIFGINMALLYGEGAKAFIRLQEETIRHDEDDSILAWGLDTELVPKIEERYWPCGVLASSPIQFISCGDIRKSTYRNSKPSAVITSHSLEIHLPIFYAPFDEYSDI